MKEVIAWEQQSDVNMKSHLHAFRTHNLRTHDALTPSKNRGRLVVPHSDTIPTDSMGVLAPAATLWPLVDC
jgi:hypothetical protein